MYESADLVRDLFPLWFTAILISPFVIVFIMLKRIYFNAQELEMTEEEKGRCTAQVQGRVSCVTKANINFSLPIGMIPRVPWMKFSAKYRVNGKAYRIKEQAVFRKRMTPLIGYMQYTPIACWRKVTVCYDPQNPQMAYVLENAIAEE